MKDAKQNAIHLYKKAVIANERMKKVNKCLLIAFFGGIAYYFTTKKASKDRDDKLKAFEEAVADIDISESTEGDSPCDD